MRAHRTLAGVAAALVSASVGWAAARLPVAGCTRVEWTDASNGKEVLSALLGDGEPVVLTWKNSLFGQTVTEELFAQGGRLVLRRVTFADSGPGSSPPMHATPRDLDDLYHTGGPFSVEGLSRPVERVIFRVGEIGNPTIAVSGRVLALKEVVGFGGRVAMAARPALLYELAAARVTAWLERGFVAGAGGGSRTHTGGCPTRF